MAAVEKSTEEGTEVVERPKSYEGWAIDRREVHYTIKGDRKVMKLEDVVEDLTEGDFVDSDPDNIDEKPLDELFQYR